jgi:hypothetical protein
VSDWTGLVTWQEVADQLPADVVAAILAGPAPLLVRAGRALAAWWARPRGSAAVIAAVGEAHAATIRVLLAASEDRPR